MRPKNAEEAREIAKYEAQRIKALKNAHANDGPPPKEKKQELIDYIHDIMLDYIFVSNPNIEIEGEQEAAKEIVKTFNLSSIIFEIEKWDEAELFWSKDKLEWHLALITYDGSGVIEGKGETLKKAYKKIQEKVT